MTLSLSLSAGIGTLFIKEMSLDKRGNMNWRSGSNGNWNDAVQRYNGEGVSDI